MTVEELIQELSEGQARWIIEHPTTFIDYLAKSLGYDDKAQYDNVNDIITLDDMSGYEERKALFGYGE